MNKVNDLRSDMNITVSDSCKLDSIMCGKNWPFDFKTVTQEAVEQMVKFSKDTFSGVNCGGSSKIQYSAVYAKGYD